MVKKDFFELAWEKECEFNSSMVPIISSGWVTEYEEYKLDKLAEKLDKFHPL